MITIKKKLKRLTGVALTAGCLTSLNAATYGNGTANYGAPTHPTAPQTWSGVHTASAWTGAAIQSAINNANGAGGGTVKLGQGTYWVSSTINLKSNVRIEGAGETKTFIKRSGNAKPSAIFYTSNSTWRNVDFASLTIHGNNAISDMKANHSSPDIDTSGIDIAGNQTSKYGDKVRLRDVAIYRCKNGFIGGGYTNSKIEYCDISQNGSDGTNSSLHHNVYWRRVGRIFFYKTDMKSAFRGAGMKFWGGTFPNSSESKDMEINYCWVNDNWTSNLEANGWVDGRFQNSEFHDSVGGSGSRSGILLGTSGSQGAKYVDVINNKVQSNNNYGINAESAGSHVNVEGNYSSGNGINYNILTSSSYSDNNTSW